MDLIAYGCLFTIVFPSLSPTIGRVDFSMKLVSLHFPTARLIMKKVAHVETKRISLVRLGKMGIVTVDAPQTILKIFARVLMVNHVPKILSILQ